MNPPRFPELARRGQPTGHRRILLDDIISVMSAIFGGHMNIGFLYIATAQSGDLPTVARRAEEIGFDSLWIPEHPIIPVERTTPYLLGGELPEHYGRWTDPFVALTMAAAVTTRLKVATGICLLPERETLVTAKAIASLDYYSRGRLLLGIGAGWLREETEIKRAEKKEETATDN